MYAHMTELETSLRISVASFRKQWKRVVIFKARRGALEKNN